MYNLLPLCYNKSMNSEFYTSIDRFGNKLLYCGYDGEGKRIEKRVMFKPKVFIPTKDKNEATDKKSIFGAPVKEVRLDSMRDMRDFVNQYKHIPSFEIFGTDRHVMAFTQEKFPGRVDYDSRFINISNMDIETAVGDGFPNPATAAEEVRAITIKQSRDGQYYVFAFKKQYAPHMDGVNFIPCKDEADMLNTFLEWWQQPYNRPDVLTGWNTMFFDVPYLINRIEAVLGEGTAKLLSPWKLISARDVNFYGQKRPTFEISGIQHLDYIELFKKFAYTYGNQESYTLNHIAHIVLGETKLDYSEIGNLNDLYEKNFQKFIEYNIKDVGLVDALDDKLGFIDICFTLSYMAGTNYADALKTTPIWDGIIYRRLCEANVVPPISNAGKTATSYAGGFVKIPQVGMHDWVMSFDLNSLYPSLIIQNNMSTETLLPKRNLEASVQGFIDETFRVDDPDITVAANGAQFKTNKVGFIPMIVSEIYAKRKGLKGKMIEAMQEREALLNDLSLLEAV